MSNLLDSPEIGALMNFNSIEEILNDFKDGHFVIMVDDQFRENEGDFIIAAEKITPEKINFMSSIGRGLICVPIHHTIAERLDFKLMVPKEEATNDTPFTVSVDAKNNLSTGISTLDRSNTINLIANISSSKNDFVRPGHVFPLIAAKNGLKERQGHTEAAVQLAILSHFSPASVLCEILNEDGTVAKGEQLFSLAKKYGIKIGTIEDLIKYLEIQN